MSDTRPLPILIGSTENALRALLIKTLSATVIKTYPAWVILNAISAADAKTSGENWRRAAASALKFDLQEVDNVCAELRTAGLIGSDGALTTLDANELAMGRSAVSSVTSRVVDAIGDDEQLITRRVLDHMRRKADELLQT